MRAIEERRQDTGNAGIFKKREPGVTEYSFPTTRREDLENEDKITKEPPNTQYTAPVQLVDITDEYHEEMAGKTTHGGGVIPFMILTRKKGTKEWGFPPTKIFFDLVNMLDTVTVGDRYLNAVLSWSNLWGGVGLVGLNSRNYDLLQTFRSYISDAHYNGSEFCSIPKEGVVVNNDL